MLGVGAEDVQVHPQRGQVGDLEQRGALRRRHAHGGRTRHDHAIDRRGDGVGGQAEVALHCREHLAGAYLVTHAHSHGTDWSGEACSDLRDAPIDWGQQPLHLMLIGNLTGSSRRDLDTRRLRSFGRDLGFQRRFLVLAVLFALSGVASFRCFVGGRRVAGRQHQGHAQCGPGKAIHGVSPVEAAAGGVTSAWPVSR